MTLSDVLNILKSNGYTIEKEKTDPRYPYTIEQSAYKRITGSNCQTNDRPPPIVFTISQTNLFEITSISMEAHLRGEAVSGRWCDIGQYAMSLEDIDNLSDIEYEITKQWEILN